MKVTFQLNGTQATFDVEPEMPLLWLLRDLENLRGTKYGCGQGLCGACTVHLDGEPVRSCQVKAETLEGRAVTTIEGLSEKGDHPVQKAWLELQVPQCGYCQSGQIMSAAALLARHAEPSAAQIDEAMRGNLCRCGTYPRIRKAIALAARGR